MQHTFKESVSRLDPSSFWFLFVHYGYFIYVCSLRPGHLEDNEQPGEVIYVSNLNILETDIRLLFVTSLGYMVSSMLYWATG